METIFFQSVCVDIHKSVAATTYIKASAIGDHRLSIIPEIRSWLTWNGCYSSCKNIITSFGQLIHTRLNRNFVDLFQSSS